MIGMKNQPLHIGRGDMKDPGLAMIDPDNGVIVMRAHVQCPFRIPLTNVLRLVPPHH
jgi:hypothetical protein